MTARIENPAMDCSAYSTGICEWEKVNLKNPPECAKQMGKSFRCGRKNTQPLSRTIPVKIVCEPKDV